MFHSAADGICFTFTDNKSCLTVVGEEEDSGRSSWSEETVSEASGSSSTCEEYSDMQWPTSFFTQFKVSDRIYLTQFSQQRVKNCILYVPFL